MVTPIVVVSIVVTPIVVVSIVVTPMMLPPPPDQYNAGTGCRPFLTPG
jgi:hypothetical protein